MNRIMGTAVGLFILGAAMLFLPAQGVAGPIIKGEAVGTHVFCGGPATIGGALGRTQPIRPHGTCRETLNINDNRVNITIIGDGGGNGLTGQSACSDGRNTLIIGDDPTAAQIVQVRGKNISITGVEITGISAANLPARLALPAGVWDPTDCGGDSDASNPDCNDNRGIRATRGGFMTLGRNVVRGDFGGPPNAAVFIEQTGICVHHVGGNGIEVAQGSFARVANSEVHTVSGDGVVVGDGSVISFGVLSGGELGDPTDPFPSTGHSGPNIVRDNAGNGITIDRHSIGRIVGNFIHDNASRGIRVRRHSHADVASNLINSNGADGVRVDDTSNVSLGQTGSSFCAATKFGAFCSGNSQADLPNTTSTGSPNGGFGVRCTINSSVSGRLTLDRENTKVQPLTGSSGSKSFGTFGFVTNDNCVDKTN